MNTTPSGKTSRARRLAADAAQAAQVRAYDTHPDVVALRVERVRTQVDALMWVGIALGLGFTMVNVQQFAAAGAAVFSLSWCAAWLLDPMVSIVLVAVLRAEQVTARWQIETGVWVRRVKWFAFAATYVMNTWQSWAALNAAGIVLHSIPPALVFLAAESAPVLRDRLTASVHAAAERTTTAGVNAGEAAGVNTTAAAEGSATDTVHEHPPTPQPTSAASVAAEHPPPTVVKRPGRARAPKPRARPAAGRTSRADYLAAARAAWTPGTDITPAWVRQVTGCSRGLSSALAVDLRDETDTGGAVTSATEQTPAGAASLTTTTSSDVAAPVGAARERAA